MIATQSSWFFTVAPVISTVVLLPMSKPSVLAPRLPVSPAEASIVTPVMVKSEQSSMLKTCTGGFKMLMSVIVDEMRSWAWKNLGLVTPPSEPSPSQYIAPCPFRVEPDAPVIVMLVPEIAKRGPDHSSKPKVVSPSKVTWSTFVSFRSI